MIIAEELWVLDRVERDLAVDTITNVWATVTGWFDAYVWGATLALLLLLVGDHVPTLGPQTNENLTAAPLDHDVAEGRQMKAIVFTGMLLVLPCVAILASSNVTAWARHYGVAGAEFQWLLCQA
jgi:hypothetical protein